MICVKNVSLGYDKKIIVDGLSVNIESGNIISIIGPNGSGKSTLLKSLTKLLKPHKGVVSYDGIDVLSHSNKEFSKKVAILSQHNEITPDITVKQLVSYGRLPHKKWYQNTSKYDYEKITLAMKSTKVYKYKDKPVSSLSGGEQQRVWIAMTLAQSPSVLLLDEPTTYLDISHQIELMNLIKHVNEHMKITVIMVLHDLNQASKYSDRIIMMKDGRIFADGNPNDVMTYQNLKDVYNISCNISKDSTTLRPLITPIDVVENDLANCV